MENATIISYSRSRNDSLLSLTESRSRYMLPFGGCFRIVDFTIRNALYSCAKKAIIFSDFQDGLEEYVSRYGSGGNINRTDLKVVIKEFSDIKFCQRIISESDTALYVIYNGDNPSIIDFSKIIREFKNNKSKASLYKLKISGTASMAHTILVSTKKSLMDIIKKAIKSRHTSPNIFEMIINIMINKGIKNKSTDAYYWPMKSVPDYYYLNMEILRNQAISSLIFFKSPVKSFITEKGQAILGENAKVADSIVSDNCKIFGTVMNSILFPGVEIGENTIVKDSIILPNNIIGPDSHITKTIIDERTDRKILTANINGKENTESDTIKNIMPYLNIGSRCSVGTNDGQIKNSEFPSLNGSISLIGKNCRIPEGARIGGACYVASGKGESYFQKNRHLYNGLSVLN